LWRAKVVPFKENGVIGQVVAVRPEGMKVVCGASSALELIELQRPGGKRLNCAQFFQGHMPSDWLGQCLGA
jgi:methionyl-tRNA formyltransferase